MTEPATDAAPEPAAGPAVTPAPEGLLLVDKPSGPTSHDVVGRVRAILSTRRVGHAGTLDPMASGLLVLAVGRATKLLGHLALTDKTYTATIRLGQSTDTDDAQGDVVAGSDASRITEDRLHEAMRDLTGDLMQVPSSVSAVKVDGRRAYARVRAGEQVQLAARAVTVSRFDSTAPPRPHGAVLDVDVVVACSTGTYVRALARDLGTALGVGGHLTVLRRESVGPFDVAETIEVYPDGVPDRGGPRPEIADELREAVAAAVRPVDAVARSVFGVRQLDEAHALDLSHGRPVPPAGVLGVYAAFAPDGTLVALLTERDGAARPVLVWRPAG
jgi:tRNA pseudouridine55 synthase